jgi:hypothetical protein
MNTTLERLKYRLKKNKYITAQHVEGVIREVGELNTEEGTVAHLLKLAEDRGWLGKVDESGFYPSSIVEAVAQSGRLGGDQENRIWLMSAVSPSKVRL